MGEEFTCKYCGASFDPKKSVGGVIRCVYCGNVQTLPKGDASPAALSFIRMGEHDLDTCKFDDAFTAYSKAAELDSEEPEAYFGMALAAFKVQYLKDEVNEHLQPICHEISEKVFSDDKNFRKALELATDEQRREYRKRGREIDEIKEEFYDLQRKGLDYDCFLCVKVTDGDKKTADCDRANDIYYHLKDEGYKPFFSEREMKGRTGSDYEALILYALYMGECMLIVCSDEAYLETKWVKNEYTRFLHMLANEEKERDALTFVFSGKPVEKLPNGKKVQGIDLTKPDAYSRIDEFVRTHTPEARARREAEAERRRADEEERNREFEELKKKFAQIEAERATAAVPAREESPAAGKPASSKALKKQAAAKSRFERDLKKAKRGNRAACYRLGVCYRDGRGAVRDEEKTEEWFLKAAEKGYPPAQYDLGRFYEYIGDNEKAAAWYRKAAEKGHGPSQDKIAEWYEEGQGFPQDRAEAIVWYHEAAKRGSENAKRKLKEFGEKAPKVIHKSWLPLTALLGVCSAVVIILFCLGCNYLDLGSAAGVAFTVMFALACLVFLVRALINGFCNDWWEDGHVFKYPATDGAPHWVGIFYAAWDFLGPIAIGAAIYTVDELWPTILLFIGGGIVLLGRLFLTGLLSGGWWRILADYLALGLFCVSVGFGWVSFRRLSVYGNITTDGSYYYCCKDDGTLSFLLADYGEEELVVPEEWNGKAVTEIRNFLKKAYPALKSVVIPDCVTSIEAGVFAGCPSLETVVVPLLGWETTKIVTLDNAYQYDENGDLIRASVTTTFSEYFTKDDPGNAEQYIGAENYHAGKYLNGSSAGQVTYSLFSIYYVPVSLRSVTVLHGDLPYCAFDGFSMLSEIVIPDDAVSIGNYAFRGCAALSDIVIPDGVTSIGDGAFEGCSGLKNVTMPKKFEQDKEKLFGDQAGTIEFTFTE